MKDVIIVCAGSYGKEVHSVIKSINNKAHDNNEPYPYKILGFISDDPNALDDYECEEKIIGSIVDWFPKDNEVYALGLGKPESKEKVVTLLKNSLGIDGKTVQEMGSVESQDGNNISIIMYIVVESDKTLDIKLSEHSDYIFMNKAKLSMIDLIDSDKKFISDYQEEIAKMVQ